FEFVSDCLQNTDLQKSNADTMTDIFAHDVGAFVATLLAFWFYHHRRTSPRLREELGHLARWLTGGLGLLLDRRGGLVGTLFVLAILGLVAAFWLVDRRPLPLPPGLGQGQPQTWTFASGTLEAPGARGAGGAGGAGGATALPGDWRRA